MSTNDEQAVQQAESTLALYVRLHLIRNWAVIGPDRWGVYARGGPVLELANLRELELFIAGIKSAVYAYSEQGAVSPAAMERQS